MRGRKNGAPSTPTNPVPVEPEPDEVDQAFDRLSDALKYWRGAPYDRQRITTLVEAFDAKETALRKLVDEDVKKENAALAASSTP